MKKELADSRVLTWSVAVSVICLLIWFLSISFASPVICSWLLLLSAGHRLKFKLTIVSKPFVFRMYPDEANILTQENKRIDFNFVYACPNDACKFHYFPSMDAVREHYLRLHENTDFRFTIKSMAMCGKNDKNENNHHLSWRLSVYINQSQSLLSCQRCLFSFATCRQLRTRWFQANRTNLVSTMRTKTPTIMIGSVRDVKRPLRLYQWTSKH